MKETERTKRGEMIFERIRELSMTGKSEALKKAEPTPDYLVIGVQEMIDLADYLILEKMINPVDANGTMTLFGLKFIDDERRIMRF